MSRRHAAIDGFIGARVRERRLSLGLTQHQLGKLIGVTHDRICKFEQGGNGITAGRLYELARALEVTTLYFYDGLEDGQLPQTARRILFELARLLDEIHDKEHLAAFSQLTRALAGR